MGLRYTSADAEYLSNHSSLNCCYLHTVTTPNFVRVTMIDKSLVFNDAPPPYQHVLQSSSDSTSPEL